MELLKIFKKQLPPNFTVVAGDIGATKTNIAFFKYGPGGLTVVKEQTFRTRDYPDLVKITTEFLTGMSLPDRFCFGVAGPVQDGKVSLTNIGWEIDAAGITAHFNTPTAIINDLEATAYGLAELNENDIETLYSGNKASPGNIAILAPGTGLGEAGIYWDGDQHHPFATEGGHCDFAPRTKTDIELYYYLEQKFGHVSWERVLSGPGIHTIFLFFKEVKKMEVPGWLAEKMQIADPAAIISENAANCAVCTETMETFFRFLAHESSNIALKVKATAGVYIGGGIIRKNIQHINKADFAYNFCNSGRMNKLLQNMPVTVILNDKAAMLGAAFYGAYIY